MRAEIQLDIPLTATRSVCVFLLLAVRLLCTVETSPIRRWRFAAGLNVFGNRTLYLFLSAGGSYNTLHCRCRELEPVDRPRTLIVYGPYGLHTFINKNRRLTSLNVYDTLTNLKCAFQA